jgi:CSLREA domain-containing protein
MPQTPTPSPILTTALIVNATDDTDDGSCDSSHCSLREAINTANKRPGPDTILFDPTVFPLSETGVIELDSPLPPIVDGNTTIDATGAEVTIDGSKLVGDITHGLFICSSSSNTVRGIRIQNVPGAGIHVSSFEGKAADNNTLDNITVINCGHGGLPSFTGRTDAIWIQAIDVGSSTCFNTVINCTVENNADDGIEIVSDRGGVVDNNLIVGNIVRGNAEVGIEIDAKSLGSSASHNKVTNNTIEGTNIENNGGIIVNCHGEGTADGNIIDSNTVVKCRDWGIAILTWDPGSSASHNKVVNNTVKDTAENGGITISSNNGGTVDSNTVDSNIVVANACYGISISTWDLGSSASENVLINNTIERNDDTGIRVDSRDSAMANYNCVQQNSIRGHKGVGIRVGGDHSLIFHNNFIQNDVQATDDGKNTRWNYDGKGNYWSDYTGKDEDGDGIGDTPIALAKMEWISTRL